MNVIGTGSLPARVNVIGTGSLPARVNVIDSGGTPLRSDCRPNILFTRHKRKLSAFITLSTRFLVIECFILFVYLLFYIAICNIKIFKQIKLLYSC